MAVARAIAAPVPTGQSPGLRGLGRCPRNRHLADCCPTSSIAQRLLLSEQRADEHCCWSSSRRFSTHCAPARQPCRTRPATDFQHTEKALAQNLLKLLKPSPFSLGAGLAGEGVAKTGARLKGPFAGKPAPTDQADTHAPVEAGLPAKALPRPAPGSRALSPASRLLRIRSIHTPLGADFFR